MYQGLIQNSENNICATKQLAKAISVSISLAAKVIKAYKTENFNILDRTRSRENVGIGTKCIDDFHRLCLFKMRYENLYQSNLPYVKGLRQRIGTMVLSSNTTRFCKDPKCEI